MYATHRTEKNNNIMNMWQVPIFLPSFLSIAKVASENWIESNYRESFMMNMFGNHSGDHLSTQRQLKTIVE